MTPTTEFLKTREWVIVIFYLAMMFTITLITQVIVPKERPTHQIEHVLRSNMIDVSITGAVEAPGLYKVPKGSTIKDLLALAKPLTKANISKIKLGTHLSQGRHVRIPEREMVTVRIEGEVEESVTIKVEKGTKLKELFDFVAFTETANPNALLKNRPARDGETIKIPKKRGKTGEKYCKKT